MIAKKPCLLDQCAGKGHTELYNSADVIDILESLSLSHSLKNDMKMTAKEVQDLEDSLEFRTQLDTPLP